MFVRHQIRSFEMGLLFRDREFVGLLPEGTHWFFDPWKRVCVDVVSQREPGLVHEQLDLIVKSGVLEGKAVVLDLKEHERALVWIDNRFSRVLPSGLYAFWTGLREVRTEVVDARTVRFEHPELKAILRTQPVLQGLVASTVGRDSAGVLYYDGQYQATLSPGTYAFWMGLGDVKVIDVDLRECRQGDAAHHLQRTPVLRAHPHSWHRHPDRSGTRLAGTSRADGSTPERQLRFDLVDGDSQAVIRST